MLAGGHHTRETASRMLARGRHTRETASHTLAGGRRTRETAFCEVCKLYQWSLRIKECDACMQLP